MISSETRIKQSKIRKHWWAKSGSRAEQIEHIKRGWKNKSRALISLINGYARVKFMGRWIYAHQLAAIYYWGPREPLNFEQPLLEGLVVHHNQLAYDKLDNRQKCLELMTNSEHSYLHRKWRIKQ